jgi:hypothetical protein
MTSPTAASSATPSTPTAIVTSGVTSVSTGLPTTATRPVVTSGKDKLGLNLKVLLACYGLVLLWG